MTLDWKAERPAIEGATPEQLTVILPVMVEWIETACVRILDLIDASQALRAANPTVAKALDRKRRLAPDRDRIRGYLAEAAAVRLRIKSGAVLAMPDAERATFVGMLFESVDSLTVLLEAYAEMYEALKVIERAAPSPEAPKAASSIIPFSPPRTATTACALTTGDRKP